MRGRGRTGRRVRAAALLGGGWLGWLCLGAWVTTPAPGAVGNELPAATEHEVKAAFLYNFAKFVDWPPRAFAEAGSPLVIGLVGEDPLGEVLPALVRSEQVKGRPLEVRRLAPDGELAGCHLLYLSRSEAARTQEILERVRQQPVLTVSDQEDFLAQGGMINFVLFRGTVRFEINAAAAQAARLKLSSKLLAVARAVVKST